MAVAINYRSKTRININKRLQDNLENRFYLLNRNSRYIIENNPHSIENQIVHNLIATAAKTPTSKVTKSLSKKTIVASVDPIPPGSIDAAPASIEVGYIPNAFDKGIISIPKKSKISMNASDTQPQEIMPKIVQTKMS